MTEEQIREAIELLKYYAELEAGLRKSYGWAVSKKIGKVNKAEEFLNKVGEK